MIIFLVKKLASHDIIEIELLEYNVTVSTNKYFTLHNHHLKIDHFAGRDSRSLTLHH